MASDLAMVIRIRFGLEHDHEQPELEIGEEQAQHEGWQYEQH